MQNVTITHELEGSTLAELRAFVAQTEHLPGSALVVAATRIGKGTRHGARIKRITADYTGEASGSHEQPR